VDRDPFLIRKPAVAVQLLRVFLISILLLSTASVSMGVGAPVLPPETSSAAVVEQAEAAFAEGVRLREEAAKARPHFRLAAQYFEGLRQHGIENAVLYRNLGNAWLLAGDLPQAILSYRRGLRLAPGDRDLRASLSEARALVVYPSGSSLGQLRPERRPPWLPYLSPRWFFFPAVACYALACVVLTRWLMLRKRKLLTSGINLLVAAALLMIGMGALRHWQVQETARPIVVIADDGVLLRKGDNLQFPPRYQTPVNKGVEAKLLFARGDWVQIELAGGEVGWVPRGLVLVDDPE